LIKPSYRFAISSHSAAWSRNSSDRGCICDAPSDRSVHQRRERGAERSINRVMGVTACAMIQPISERFRSRTAELQDDPSVSARRYVDQGGRFKLVRPPSKSKGCAGSRRRAVESGGLLLFR
jgi:hypothetical protein